MVASHAPPLLQILSSPPHAAAFANRLVCMHDHEPGHIPPPDPHRQKRVLGLKPHHLAGGLVLIAILIMYLLLMARRGL